MKTEQTTADKIKEQVNTLLKAVGLKAEEVKLMEAKLKDGETVVSAEPDFEAGATVMVMTEDGQEIAMPPIAEGEFYELEDGRMFSVVEEGVIAEMKEAGAEEEPAEEEEVAASDAPAAAPVPKAVIESIVKETKFSKADMDAKDTIIADLEAKILELEKVEEVVEVVEEVELSTAAIKHNPEEKTNTSFRVQSDTKLSIAERAMQNMANLK
jgi:hypothetical protein